jgi:hypothetical protein
VFQVFQEELIHRPAFHTLRDYRHAGFPDSVQPFGEGCFVPLGRALDSESYLAIQPLTFRTARHSGTDSSVELTARLQALSQVHQFRPVGVLGVLGPP